MTLPSSICAACGTNKQSDWTTGHSLRTTVKKPGLVTKNSHAGHARHAPDGHIRSERGKRYLILQLLSIHFLSQEVAGVEEFMPQRVPGETMEHHRAEIRESI